MIARMSIFRIKSPKLIQAKLNSIAEQAKQNSLCGVYCSIVKIEMNGNYNAMCDM